MNAAPLVFALLVACGGSAPKVQDATVARAANPRAVEKYVAHMDAILGTMRR